MRLTERPHACRVATTNSAQHGSRHAAKREEGDGFPIRGQGQKQVVDWYLDGDDAHATSLLRHEMAAYLRRHGEATSEFADAELVIAEVLGNAARHAGGPVWVSLSWQEACRL